MDQRPNPESEGTIPGSDAAEQRGEEVGDDGSLRQRARRSTVWTLVGHGTSQALRLLNNLILWRLLFPEAFGLMALVQTVLTGISLFSDIGIGPSLVQHKRGEDPTYLNTAWTIQVIRAFILCLVACLIARPVASFYAQPQLSTLIPAAAVSSLLSGFNSTRLFTQTRRLSLGRLTVLDLVSGTAGLVAMIGWAWLYRSIWSLIFGGAVTNATRLALSHTFLPGIRNRFRLDPSSLRSLLHFGRWIFLSTVLTFLVMHSDRIVFGKLIPIGMLGVYSLAATWASMPVAIVSRLFDAVLFPLLSHLQSDDTKFLATFRRARRPCLFLAGWAAAGLMSGGPTLIHLLYEERATNAGWIIQILATGIWFQAIESANRAALLALGQPKWLAAGNASKLLGMVILIPVSYAYLGFPGAVAGFVASELGCCVVLALGTVRLKVACLGQDLAVTGLVAITAGIGMLVARWLGPVFRGLAIRPAKVAVLVEGLVIAVCVSIGWGWVYFAARSKKKGPVPHPGAAQPA